MADFEVFSVDLAKLDGVVGSRDPKLLAAIATPDDPPELRAAMHAIITSGTRPFGGDPYSLARATLRMLRVVGRRVNANTADLLSSASLAGVTEVSQPLGLAVHVAELVAADIVPIRGLPVDEEMRFGVIEAGRIPDGFARWSSARPADAVDDDVDGLLAEMLDWLEVAALRSESLVGVYWL